MGTCLDCAHFKKENEGGVCRLLDLYIPDPGKYSCPKFTERRRGPLGIFPLGPLRGAIRGAVVQREHGDLQNRRSGSDSSQPHQEARPADELELMADRAARKYREKIEGAVERYRKRWAEAMRE